MEFHVGERVYRQVSLIKGVRRFNVKGKLSLRYIGSFEIFEKLNLLSYRLDLPTKHKHVHNIFHISQLRKYVPHPNYVIKVEPIEVAENLVYE